jgi:CheY-like chemotaxis protein
MASDITERKLAEEQPNEASRRKAGPGRARPKRSLPQVCLVDIGLPDFDGKELARRLRAQPGNRNAVLVAVTGYGQDSDRLDALSAGFDHHLVKPVDRAKLFAILAGIKRA